MICFMAGKRASRVYLTWGMGGLQGWEEGWGGGMCRSLETFRSAADTASSQPCPLMEFNSLCLEPVSLKCPGACLGHALLSKFCEISIWIIHKISVLCAALESS